VENELIEHLEANMNALEADYLALADKIQQNMTKLSKSNVLLAELMNYEV